MIQNIQVKKLFILIYLIVFCSFGFNYLAVGQVDSSKIASVKTLKLMTYNIKFASPTYEPSWEVRREMQVDLIRKYKPDIIGTQEGLKEQID